MKALMLKTGSCKRDITDNGLDYVVWLLDNIIKSVSRNSRIKPLRCIGVVLGLCPYNR